MREHRSAAQIVAPVFGAALRPEYRRMLARPVRRTPIPVIDLEGRSVASSPQARPFGIVPQPLRQTIQAIASSRFRSGATVSCMGAFCISRLFAVAAAWDAGVAATVILFPARPCENARACTPAALKVSMNSKSSWQEGLPSNVVSGIEDLQAQSLAALGDDLVAIVLFGSAAEGRLRATSDVNVAIVLERFDPQKIQAWSGGLQMIAAAIELEPLLLLRNEVHDAAEAFAVKFSDILMRHRVVYGTDPVASLSIPREALVRRLKQVLLNLVLRMRQALALYNDAGQTRALVDALGPLRSAAMSLLQAEGRSAPSSREALTTVAGELNAQWPVAIERVRLLREQGTPVVQDAPALLGTLIECAQALFARANRLQA